MDKTAKIKVLTEPHQLLHQKCEPVTNVEEAKQIADDLLIVVKSLTKWWNRFVGFAANQIGYSRRAIVLRRGKSKYEVMINPVFVEKKFPFPYLENCFSVRGLYLVKRYLWSKVKYQDIEGNPQEIIFKGFAGVYQEIDHIDGILVSDIGLLVYRSKPLKTPYN